MTNGSASGRSKRMNMRLTPEAYDTIKKAAQIQQQDLTSFVLGAALERARAVLAEDLLLRMTRMRFGNSKRPWTGIRR